MDIHSHTSHVVFVLSVAYHHKIRLVLAVIFIAFLILPSSGQNSLANATDYSGNWAAWQKGYAVFEKDYNASAWVNQSDVTLDGVDAAKTLMGGSLEGPITSGLEVQIFGPVTLYYSYRAITVPDRLGNSQWSGPGIATYVNPGEASDTEWREASYQVPAGSHLISWSVSTGIRGGTVTFYVDQVWTSLDSRPRILTTDEQKAVFQQAFGVTLEVASKTPYVLTVADLPPGLAYDSARRRISGTPTQAGRFAAKMIAENASGRHVAHLHFWIEPGNTSIAEAIDNFIYVPNQTADGPQWHGVVGMGHDGIDCLRLDPTAYKTLQLAVPGPGILRYWYWSDSLRSELTQFSGLRLDVDGQSGISEMKTAEWKQFSLPISQATNVAWITYRGTLEKRFLYLDGIEFIPDAPQMQVQSAAGTLLENATTLPLGTIAPGTKNETLLKVRNAGRAALENLVIEAEGLHAQDLTIERSGLGASLAPDQEGSFRVIVDARHAGPRSARVRILSNDTTASPWVVDFRYVGDSRFTVQPSSQTIGVGTGVAFTVNAELFDGSAATYQWFKDGEVYSATTGGILNFTAAMPWNAGTYKVQIPGANGPVMTGEAALRFTDVPSAPWRNVRSAYPLNGVADDVVRPASPAVLENDVTFVEDPERGSVVEISGKGFSVPSFDWEPLASRGPGGSLRLPRPVAGNGEPFSLFFWIRELGYSSWHGEAFFTLGEGSQSADLLGHYGVGGLTGWTDHYGTTSAVVAPLPSDPSVVNAAGEATLDVPWSSWALVAAGDSIQVYRNGRFLGLTDYPRDTSGDLFVGKHWWTDGVLRHSTRLRARLDDVRVFGRPLTATDVAQLHTTTAVDSPDAYRRWARQTALSPQLQGVDADPDGDGFPNLTECAFGTPPTEFSERVASFSVGRESSTLMWEGRPDFYYELEGSYDAKTWFPAAFPISAAPDQSGTSAGYTRMQADLPVPDPIDAIPVYLARIRAEAPPIFTDGGLKSQPGNGEPLAGEEFQLAASGLGANVSWQWYRDDFPLDGAVTSRLVVPSAKLTDTGAYHVTATNRAGTSTSQKVYILVR